MCNDLQRFGYQRSLVVPRVKLAYKWPHYERLHTLRKQSFNRQESIPVEFKPVPSRVWCAPLDIKGQRGPDGPGGYMRV